MRIGAQILRICEEILQLADSRFDRELDCYTPYNTLTDRPFATINTELNPSVSYSATLSTGR